MTHDAERRRLILGGAAGLGAAVAAPLQAASAAGPRARGTASVRVSRDASIARTTHGRVRGFERHRVHVFRGVPYAGAPVGAARFRRAPPLAPWDGVRNAYGYGPICPRAGGSADISQLEWSMLIPRAPDTPASEDCLRLNVWTRGLADGGRRPVLVWMHSQGFGGGSSHEFLATDGENLARNHDLVVVTVNHRVGVLGFFGFDDAAANVGMLDLVDALHFVRANAAAFGGDPDLVTVGGQSGGGFKTTVLLAMPEARGLFQRAIVQSGSRLRVHTPESGRALASEALRVLDVSPTETARLASVPVERLLEASMEAARRIESVAPRARGFDAPPFYWQPTAGVESLPTQPCDPDAPPQSRDVPLLVGSTRHEIGGSIADESLEAIDWEGVAQRLRASLGARTEDALAAARADHPQARPVEVLAILESRRFRMSAIAHAERKARQGGAPAFQYLFAWETQLFDGRPRAFHTSDICFVFDNTDLCDTQTGGNARARTLASSMATAWATFARTGRPAAPRLPRWPPYDPQERATMILDDRCRVQRDPEAHLRAFFGTEP